MLKRIGLFDEETEYVERLAVYLGEYGAWNVVAFSDRELFKKYIQEHRMDVILSTDRELLHCIRQEKEELIPIWLSEEGAKGSGEYFCVYRYQRAKEIGKQVEIAIHQSQLQSGFEIQMVFVYSPVNRCGKTTLALRLVEESFGKWLYLGMEDYSIVAQEESMEDFFYYWMERRLEKILEIIKQGNGRVVLTKSPFEARMIRVEDLLWLKELLKESDYQGLVLDIGTGVLQDFELLHLADFIVLPFVSEEAAEKKVELFEETMKQRGRSVILEKVRYLNMTKEIQIKEQLAELFGG